MYECAAMILEQKKNQSNATIIWQRVPMYQDALVSAYNIYYLVKWEDTMFSYQNKIEALEISW